MTRPSRPVCPYCLKRHPLCAVAGCNNPTTCETDELGTPSIWCDECTGLARSPRIPAPVQPALFDDWRTNDAQDPDLCGHPTAIRRF